MSKAYSASFSASWEDKVPQSAKKNINFKILRLLKVPAPPIERQNQYTYIAEAIEKQRSRMMQELDSINKLYFSLQQPVFTVQP